MSKMEDRTRQAIASEVGTSQYFLHWTIEAKARSAFRFLVVY